MTFEGENMKKGKKQRGNVKEEEKGQKIRRNLS
jgi:hypothetical protein